MLRLILCLGLVFVAHRASAAEWFVDNRLGDDAFDGGSIAPDQGQIGPFRTIRRALERVRRGDNVSIANTGMPYYESLQLRGQRYTGFEAVPFTIEGHGVVISGARRVPPEAWEYQGDELWRYSPRRKGYYLLLKGETAVPEQPVARDATVLPKLQTGTWCAWRGAIYYQSHPELGQTPRELPLAIAYDDVGLSLVDVEHVLIRNVTFRHFRQDGVHAHDRSRYVILENVQLLENGRAGLAVGGSSLVGLKDGAATGNRLAQLINSERAQTELLNTPLGDTPGTRFKISGGHLLIDGEEVSE